MLATSPVCSKGATVTGIGSTSVAVAALGVIGIG
jgi:hypothetical protein